MINDTSEHAKTVKMSGRDGAHMCTDQWCRGECHRWRKVPLQATAERRTFIGYGTSQKDISGREEGINRWGEWWVRGARTNNSDRSRMLIADVYLYLYKFSDFLNLSFYGCNIAPAHMM